MGATHSVAKLVENLSSESSYEQEAAVQELCNIAVRSEMREFLAKKDVIPPLVKLLASGSPKARELSAATLSHLALHAPNHKRIADADAMRSLVDLLRSGTPQQQGAAAVALINLSKRSPCNQDAMGECGAVPLLVNLLRDGVPRVKEWACVALGNVALQHSANQKRVAEAGAIPQLISTFDTIPQHATASTWLSFPSTCSRRTSSLKPTVSASDQGGAFSPQAISFFLKALSSVVYNCPANQLLFCEAGGVEAMLKVIASNEVEVLSALCNVVGTASTNGAVVSAGAIPVFVRVVTRGNQQTRAIAAGLLGSLAAESQACRSWIAEQGGIRPLVELAKNGCTEGKLRAVMALCVLAEGHQENKSEIGTVGGIPVLIRLQNDKLPQMKMWSMRALSNLATDHKENDECIAAAGGTVLPSLGGMKITAVPDDAVASVDALRLNSVGTQVNKHEASS